MIIKKAKKNLAPQTVFIMYSKLSSEYFITMISIQQEIGLKFIAKPKIGQLFFLLVLLSALFLPKTGICNEL